MTRRTIEIAAFLAALLLAASAFHAWLASRDDQRRLQATLSAQQKIIASADVNERARSASLADALAQIEKLKRASQTPQQIATALQNYLSLPRPLALTHSTLPQPASPTSGKPAKTRKGTAATSVPHPPGPSSDVPASNAPRTSNSLGQIPSGQAIPYPPVPLIAACPTTTSCDANAAADSPGLPASIAPAKQSAPGTQGACPGSPDCTVQVPIADLKPLYNYVQGCRECQLRLDAANQNLADDTKKIAALTRERDTAVAAAKGGTFWRRVRRNLLWFAVGAAAATAYSAKH